MKGLRFTFLVSILSFLAASIATAQTQIQVNELNGTFGQYTDTFVVKLTVDGNTGGTYRGYSLTSMLGHQEIFWQFPVPTNNGQVMITANAIPGYQFGNPIFVPYDPAGAFCSLIINPNTQLTVGLLVTEDATGAHCTIH
jgi:hypothetical protein